MTCSIASCTIEPGHRCVGRGDPWPARRADRELGLLRLPPKFVAVAIMIVRQEHFARGVGRSGPFVLLPSGTRGSQQLCHQRSDPTRDRQRDPACVETEHGCDKDDLVGRDPPLGKGAQNQMTAHRMPHDDVWRRGSANPVGMECCQIVDPDGEIVDMADHGSGCEPARAALSAPVDAFDLPALPCPAVEGLDIFFDNVAATAEPQNRSARLATRRLRICAKRPAIGRRKASESGVTGNGTSIEDHRAAVTILKGAPSRA